MSTGGLGTVMAVCSAVVWALAAFGKFAHRAETAAAFSGLGLRGAPALAVAVPAAELATAAALLVRPQVGAAIGLALLAVFTGVIVRALAHGVETGCGCFGSRRPSPLGPADVVRNALLAAFAVVATGAHRLVAPSAGDVVVGVVLVIVAATVLGVAQHRLAPTARAR
ncbi:MAG TPA: MauE/DoxX family redox-associated membrane protein [Acidimicrobiales bacterium]|nr:MauE/DoxX family redox-associated membrane protein [Acidimicrobiales bacterium]